MKNIKTLLIAIIMITSYSLNAQVAVNKDGSTADASAMLDVKATDAGMLVPRMTAAQRNAITAPATGLLVYVTNDNNFYYYDGSAWATFSANDNDWTINGNDMYSAVTGNVGIGTTTPNSDLQISDTNPAIHITDTDATGRTASLWQHDSIFSIGEAFSTIPFNINLSTGNVGIGTDNPEMRLHIVNSTGGAAIKFENSGNHEWAVGTWGTSNQFNIDVFIIMCKILTGSGLRL